MKNGLTAVLYSKDEALRFLQKPPKVDRIYPLTPDARVPLLNFDLPTLSTIDVYTDYRQRRVLARVRRMERTFLKVLAEEKMLSLAAKETLRGEVHVLASISGYSWESLKDTGPWLIPVSSQWVSTSDIREAHQYLLKTLFHEFKKNRSPIGKPPFGAVVRLINQMAAKILSKNDSIFVSDYSYGLGYLSEQISKKTPLSTFSIMSTRGNWKDISDSVLLFKKVFQKKKNIILRAVPTPLQHTTPAVQRVLSSITDPVLLRGVNIFREFLADTIVSLDGLHEDVRMFFKIQNPQIIIAEQLRWHSGAVLGEVGREEQVPRLLISHSSHPLPDSVAAAFEHRENSQGLIVSPLADNTLLQSPHAEAFLSSINSPIQRKRSRPIMWAYREMPDTLKSGKEYYILHAGTFKPLAFPRPWIYETSDEFVKGLISLVLATSALNNVKLIIRIRPQLECSISSLKQLLPKGDHYEIKSSGNFLDDLSQSDLLVSWASTTIEEALHARKPVLLWGGSRRYRHLEAYMGYPTLENRGAVYAPDTEEDLIPLLSAILAAHQGKPLTDLELTNHVWPPSVSGVNELIEQLQTNVYRNRNHYVEISLKNGILKIVLTRELKSKIIILKRKLHSKIVKLIKILTENFLFDILRKKTTILLLVFILFFGYLNYKLMTDDTFTIRPDLPPERVSKDISTFRE